MNHAYRTARTDRLLWERVCRRYLCCVCFIHHRRLDLPLVWSSSTIRASSQREHSAKPNEQNAYEFKLAECSQACPEGCGFLLEDSMSSTTPKTEVITPKTEVFINKLISLLVT